MSGGSFEYLCHDEPRDLFGKTEQIEGMVRYLSENGHHDAASETEAVLLVLRHFEARMDARLKRLKPVWKAAEWHASGDCGDDQLAAALKAYRDEVEGQDTAQR